MAFEDDDEPDFERTRSSQWISWSAMEQQEFYDCNQWESKQLEPPLLLDPATAARSSNSMSTVEPLLNGDSNSQVLDLPMVDPEEVPDAIITVRLQKIESTQKIGMRSIACKESHRIVSIPKDGLLDRWNQKTI